MRETAKREADTPICAIPHYLNQVLKNKDLKLSAGVNFNQFLPVWEKDFTKSKKISYRNISVDSSMVKAFRERQKNLANQSNKNILVLDAKSIAPFCTGLGNEHPIENGFSFLHPYGLPYLSGSGVKGIIRRAAHELAADKTSNIELNEASINALFGEEGEENTRGALSFWDVMPQMEMLEFDVMTPHTPSYYRAKDNYPSESESPIPVYFLTVPAGSTFTFCVSCNQHKLEASASLPLPGGRWQETVEEVFSHAFEWIGFGAKKSVGYGHLEWRKIPSSEREETEEKNQAREEAIANLPDDAVELIKNYDIDTGERNHFLDIVEKYTNGKDTPLSAEAFEILKSRFEKFWSNIMNAPDQKRGKKNDYRFSERQRKLAKQLISLRPKETQK